MIVIFWCAVLVFVVGAFLVCWRRAEAAERSAAAVRRLAMGGRA